MYSMYICMHPHSQMLWHEQVCTHAQYVHMHCMYICMHTHLQMLVHTRTCKYTVCPTYMEIYPKYLYAVTATAILLRMNIEPRQISTAHNTCNYLRLLYNIKQKTLTTVEDKWHDTNRQTVQQQWKQMHSKLTSCACSLTSDYNDQTCKEQCIMTGKGHTNG